MDALNPVLGGTLKAYGLMTSQPSLAVSGGPEQQREDYLIGYLSRLAMRLTEDSSLKLVSEVVRLILDRLPDTQQEDRHE